MGPDQYAREAEELQTQEPDIPKPNWSPNFFRQREGHRKFLFWFALTTSIASLLLLIGIIVVQTWVRVTSNPEFEVVSDQGLQIIAVSIFGQVFGVVYVIAHALWSNDEFDLMKKK